MRSSVTVVLCTGLVYTILGGCSKSPRQREEAFLKAGAKHLAAHDLARATLDFDNAVQAMPADAEPHYQLGLIYLQAGDGQAGAHELMTAVRLNPAHAGAQLKIAELMAGSANPDIVRQGHDKAEQLLANSPGNVDALRTLAVAELRLDDTGTAVDHLQQALQAAPQDLKASQTLALAKLRSNDIAGAEAVLLKSVADAPRSPQHALFLGRFYQFVGRPEDAEKQFRRALEIDANYGPALMALGNLAYSKQRIDEAEQLFRRASALPDKQYRPIHAIFLFQTGKRDEAVRELSDQYNADRDDRAARTLLLTAYLKLNRAGDAVKILDAALKKNPQDADASLQRGELNLLAGRLTDAQRDLSAAIHTQKDSAKAHLLLARLQRAQGQSQNQIRELVEALRLEPRYLDARLELAQAYRQAGNPKMALDTLDQATFKDRQSLAYVLERNSALFAAGDDRALGESLQQALATSRDPRLLMQDGLFKLRAKDYRGARVSLAEVLKQQPQNWPAVQALADSYVQERNIAQALQIVRDYSARDPRSAVGQQVLGSVLFEAGDIRNAAIAFERSKNLDPNWIPASLGLVQVALKTGKLDDAARLLSGIIVRQPRNVFALFTLGQVEESLGHPDAAIAQYNKVLDADPANVQAMNNLAYLLADSQVDPKRALMLAQRVKELVPDNAAVDDTIGWAYYNNGLFDLSLNYLERAAKSGSARRKSHLAMAYIRLGDRRQAATLLQAALKEEPTSPDARRGIQLLSKMR